LKEPLLTELVEEVAGSCPICRLPLHSTTLLMLIQYCGLNFIEAWVTHLDIEYIRPYLWHITFFAFIHCCFKG